MKRTINIFLVVVLFAGCFIMSTGCQKEEQLVFGDAYSAVDERNIEQVRTVSDGFAIDENAAENIDAFLPNSIVGDGMVLQRNAVNCLYGTAGFSGEFAVRLNGQSFYGTAADGQFKIFLSPMEAGGPHRLTFFSSNQKLEISDVMIGEVLYFSGQSNMMWTMSDTLTMGKQYLQEGVYKPTESADPESYSKYVINPGVKKQFHDKATAQIEENPNIRFFHVFKGFTPYSIYANAQPLSTLIGVTWQKADEQSITTASMFAYYFAKNLQQATGLTIGAVMGAWGATNVPAWTPRETYELYKSGNSHGNAPIYYYGETDNNPQAGANNISRCYNTFVAPIEEYKFRAVVWYQGEAQYKSYAESLEVMIEAWRAKMDDPELPFLLINLPQWGGQDSYALGYSSENYADASATVGMESLSYFLSRLQRIELESTLENCAVSTALNTGDYDDIHPSDKTVEARQATDRFMEVFYGVESKTLSGPVAVSARRNDDGVVISFKNTGSGLVLKNGGINFEVSADGSRYVQAKAVLLSKTEVLIRIKSGTVNFVRYGALTFPRISRLDMESYCSVFNEEGYPSDSFLLEVENG